MSAKLGLNARLYRLTSGNRSAWGSSSAPAGLSAVNAVRDLTLSIEKSEAAVGTRGNGGWEAYKATLKKATIDFMMIYDPADADVAALIAAYNRQASSSYSQGSTANASADTATILTAHGSGSVLSFGVGLVTPPDTASGSGGKTATVDLKKNGTTILSAPITLNSTSTGNAVVAATVSSANYVDGDVFTVVVTIAGATGSAPKGVFAQTVFSTSGNPTIPMAVLDGDKATLGTQGLYADFEVLKAERGEPLEGELVLNVSIKPSLASVAPEWVTVQA